MYGYKIINGKAVIDEHEAGIIISIFNGYISGLSMKAAAANAGVLMQHSAVKRILMQDTYKMLFGRIFMDVVTVMLLVSTFASTMSAINVSGRYWYSLGKDGVLPKGLGKAHPKFHSPYVGLIGVGVLYICVIVILGVAGVDPVVIYPKINGIGTFTVMLTMFVASLSIIGFFRKNKIGKEQGGNAWNTLIAPILGAICLALFLYFALINYGELTGGSNALTAVGLIITAALFIGGCIHANVLKNSKPEVYRRIGREEN